MLAILDPLPGYPSVSHLTHSWDGCCDEITLALAFPNPPHPLSLGLLNNIRIIP